ncbi:WXG100-like domain-containing protein [Kitasatospora sp. NPDC001660]
MTIQLPPALEWVASLAVGSRWPKGDEDGMAVLGHIWEDAKRRLIAVVDRLGPAGSAVLQHVGGQVADQFTRFVQSLSSSIPDVAGAAGQLGLAARDTGVQLQHAKMMILAQLVWLANDIVDLSFWAPEAIPAAVTSARVAVSLILRRLAMAVARGAALLAGMDMGIQGLQRLMHDRTSWDWTSIGISAASGGIGGGVGGIVGEGARGLFKNAANTMIGKGAVGGVSAIAGGTVVTSVFGGPNDVAMAASGGVIGGVAGGRKGRGTTPKIDDIDVHDPVVPHLPKFEGGAGPGATGVTGTGGIGAEGTRGADDGGSSDHRGGDGPGSKAVEPVGEPSVTPGEDTRSAPPPTTGDDVPSKSPAPTSTGGSSAPSPGEATSRTDTGDGEGTAKSPTGPAAGSPAEGSGTTSGLPGFETTLTGVRPATGSASGGERPAAEGTGTARAAARPPARGGTDSQGSGFRQFGSPRDGGVWMAPRAPGWHDADGAAPAAPAAQQAPASASGTHPQVSTGGTTPATEIGHPVSTGVGHLVTTAVGHPVTTEPAAPVAGHGGGELPPSGSADQAPVTHTGDGPGHTAGQGQTAPTSPVAHAAEPQGTRQEPVAQPTAATAPPTQAPAQTREPVQGTDHTGTATGTRPGPGAGSTTVTAGTGNGGTPVRTQDQAPARTQPTETPTAPARPSLSSSSTPNAPATGGTHNPAEPNNHAQEPAQPATAHTTTPEPTPPQTTQPTHPPLSSNAPNTPATGGTHNTAVPDDGSSGSTVQRLPAVPSGVSGGAPQPASSEPVAAAHGPATAQAPATAHTTSGSSRQPDPTVSPTAQPPAGPGGPFGPRPSEVDRNAPRLLLRSGFDQRRFTFQETRYTDLTVRVAFNGDPKDAADTVNSLQQGVQQRFNDPNHVLPNGDRLHVTVEHVGPEGNPHLTVDLVPHGGRTDQYTWPIGAEPTTYTHEFTHQLGLRDESADPTNPHRADAPGSLLGDYRKPPADPGLDQGGLRNRHLQLLGTLTGGDEGIYRPPAESPGRARGSGRVPATEAAENPAGRPGALPEAPATSGPVAPAARPGTETGTPAEPPPGGSTARGPVSADPGWQNARATAPWAPREHTWVDPVAVPTRTEYPAAASSRPHTPAPVISHAAPPAEATASRPTPQDPAAQEPATQPANNLQPTTQEPTPARPTTREPADQSATSQRPATQESTSHEAANQPTAQPATHEPNSRPATSEPTTRPTTDQQSTTDEPKNQPTAQKPANNQQPTTQESTSHETPNQPADHEPADPHQAAPPPPTRPAPAPPAAPVDPRHTTSLAEIKITADPGPAAVRARIEDILGDHRTDTTVVQGLDSHLTAGNFRENHPQMVDDAWRFQIIVNGRPHEVQITARTNGWQPAAHVPTKDRAETEGKTDVESTAKSTFTPEPRKTQASRTQSALNVAPAITYPVNEHLFATGSASVSVGGANHETETTVTSKAETSNKLTLTGPTSPHIAQFAYNATVLDHQGRPLGPGGRPPLTGSVTAEIPSRGTPVGTAPRAWEGWDPAPAGRPAPEPGAHPEGQPLAVIGLGNARNAVFDALPEENRPDAPAHKVINDFFTTKNVLNEFEHAAGWGMTSAPIRFSDGSEGHLHLTLEPHGSTVLDTVDHKSELASNTSTEHKASHVNKSSRSAGFTGGVLGQVKKSTEPGSHESTWAGGSVGYSYTANRDHESKNNHTVKVASSHEHEGKADLVATDVHFHISVTKQRFSPRPDGLHDTNNVQIGGRAVTGHPPGEHRISMEAPITGQVRRVVQYPPTTHTPATHAEPAGSAGAEHAQPHAAPADAPAAPASPAPPAPPDAAGLREPLNSQRTTYLKVPGSAELANHIVTRLHTEAPGLLPPPAGAAGAPGGSHARITPQAVKNLDELHQQITPSALARGGPDLLDGRFRITLDASHLPGIDAKTFEILVKADLGPGGHVGSQTSTTKNSISLTSGGDLVVTDGGKHAVTGSGNVRSSLNPPDTTRAFVNGNLEGSSSKSHVTTTAAATETKHEFSLKSSADKFGYPVTYHVMVGRENSEHPTTVLDTGAGSAHAGQTRTFQPHDGQLVVEQHQPASPSDTPPPQHLATPRLPQASFIRHVDDQQAFRESAEKALNSAFDQWLLGHTPDLSKALDVLGGPNQLRGAVTSSHGGWSNSGEEQVGRGIRQGAAGLSTRTQMTDFHYLETLPGEGKLTIESTSKTSTAVEDKWTRAGKGGVGPDFGRFPENPTNQHQSSYQVRGGFKVKGGATVTGGDAVKNEMSTTRTLATPKGTWHVYQAHARITTVGRVTDNSGKTYYGEPQQSEHIVHVLLSDGDVRALGGHTEAPEPSDPRTAPLLDHGISGGASVHVPSSDEILGEIDRQLRGPRPAGEVPTAALPFADAFSPHNLSANPDDVMGKGILATHVDESRTNRVITQVLVRGVPQAGWRDDHQQAENEISRKVTNSQTSTGNSGGSGSLGAETQNVRISGLAPKSVPRLSNGSFNPAGGIEGTLTNGSKSGITTEVSHKTSGFGTNHKFSNDVHFDVTVSQYNSYGRFVNLHHAPQPVRPTWRVESWVPEPLTEKPAADQDPATVQPPPAQQRPDAQPQAPQPVGDGSGAPPGGGIALQPVGPHAADVNAWRGQLAGGHDMVGFDNAGQLMDNAVHTLTTPRPWGNGVLGRTGSALATGAGAVGSAVSAFAHAVTPQPALDLHHRVVQSFVSDPRLPAGNVLKQEQHLSLDMQAAVRQVFSAQSMPPVYHQLNTPGSEYRTVPLGADGQTGLAVRMEPTGPAVEVSTRDEAKDELTIGAEDASSTTSTKGYTWSATPADFSVLTKDPLVSVPVNPLNLGGQATADRSTPVTHAPGVPSRSLPLPDIPHGKAPTEAGKAELTGPQALVRQPVIITTQKVDQNGPYGEAVPTHGNLYYWTEKPAAAADTPAAAPAAAPAPAPAAAGGSSNAGASGSGSAGAPAPAGAPGNASTPAAHTPAVPPGNISSQPANTAAPAPAPASASASAEPANAAPPAPAQPANAPAPAGSSTSAAPPATTSATPPPATALPAPTSTTNTAQPANAPTPAGSPASAPSVQQQPATVTPAPATAARPVVTLDTSQHPGPPPMAPAVRRTPDDAASEVSSLHSVLSDLAGQSPVSPVSTHSPAPLGSGHSGDFGGSVLDDLAASTTPRQAPASVPAVTNADQPTAAGSSTAPPARPGPAAAPTAARPPQLPVAGQGGGTAGGTPQASQLGRPGSDRAQARADAQGTPPGADPAAPAADGPILSASGGLTLAPVPLTTGPSPASSPVAPVLPAAPTPQLPPPRHPEAAGTPAAGAPEAGAAPPDPTIR